ncbi:hypothetical protein ACT7DH_15855 [Bacillus pacificus]
MDPVPAPSVIITDPLANGLTFLPGTVVINGIRSWSKSCCRYTCWNSPVQTLQLLEVPFQARVYNVPPGGIIRNQAAVTFTYEPGPG